MSSNFKSGPRYNLSEIARWKMFRLGVADYRAKNSWREIQNSNDSLSYERGRHFAAYYPGKIYIGRGVVSDAINAFSNAVNEKNIL